jgi:hypothetical protein
VSFQDDVAAIVNNQPQQGGYGTPAGPPQVVPINPGGAQLGAGLQMPTTMSVPPSVPPSPQAMQTPALPPMSAADVAASNKTFAEAQSRGEEQRRQALIAQLEAQGAKPSTAKDDATKLDESTTKGVLNPFATKAAASGAGPSAAPTDYSKLGYQAVGDNPNDPRQRAALAALGKVSGQSADMIQQHAAQVYQQGADYQSMLSGQAAQQRYDAMIEAQKQQEAAAHAADARAKYQALADDFAKQRIDPDEIYRGAAGGARRVTSALAVALGAVGAVYGHTENFAQKIVEQQVNNSIEAQKANIANKGRALENARGAYEMLRQQGADDAQARAGTRALAYAAAARDAEAIQSGLTNEDQKRKAEELRQSFLQQQAQAEAAHTQLANQKGFEIAEQRSRAAAAANKGEAGDAAVAKLQETEAPAEAASEALHEQIDSGKGVEGYGVLGRLGRLLPADLGTTEQGRANMRNVDRLAAVEAKDEQGRVNPEMKADIIKHVRTEDDVERFLRENDYRHKVAQEAARRTAKGGGGSRKSAEED